MGTTFVQPKKPLLKYLLIPIRVILFFPILASVMILILFGKAYITLIGLIDIGILYSAGWMIDRFLWRGFLESWIAGLIMLLLLFPLWKLVAFTLGDTIQWIGKATGLTEAAKPLASAGGRLWEWLIDFASDGLYKHSCLAIYGADFPKPTFENFGLKAEEYYSYNRRFSIHELEFPLAVLSGFIAGYIAHRMKLPPFPIGFGTGIVMLFVLIGVEQSYAQTFPQFNKVRSYNRADKIYKDIQEQIRKAEIAKKYR